MRAARVRHLVFGGIVLISMVSGCATTRKVVKVYEGDEMHPNELVLLSGSPGSVWNSLSVTIEEIDGRKIYGSKSRLLNTSQNEDFVIKPGVVTVGVAVRNSGGNQGLLTAIVVDAVATGRLRRFTFTAEAGHQYRFRVTQKWFSNVECWVEDFGTGERVASAEQGVSGDGDKAGTSNL